MNRDHDLTTEDRFIWQTIRHTLNREPQGRALLALLASDPEKGAQALLEHIQPTSAAPSISTYVTGGNIAKLVAIGHAERVYLSDQSELKASAEPTLSRGSMSPTDQAALSEAIRSILHEHPTVLVRLTELVSRQAQTILPASAVPTTPTLLSSQRLNELDDESLFWFLSTIVGSDERVMTPSPTSALWQMYATADFDQLYARLHDVIGTLAARRRAWVTIAERRDIALWFYIVFALISARSGRLSRAVRAANLALRLARHTDLELRAWAFNTLSIAYGKLETRHLYVRSTRRAIATAVADENYWLADTVVLRDLHKRSWSAAEGGQPLHNDWFTDAVSRPVSDHSSKLPTAEQDHLRAQRDAYLALQFTWQPESWDGAERSIISAEHRFDRLGDRAELTRMLAERGRLYLYGYDDKTMSLGYLRSGLQRRARSGELARARYDLIWLAQAHLSASEPLWADICMWAALTVHESLYSGKRVDRGIMSVAAGHVAGTSDALNRLAADEKAGTAALLSLLQSATGMEAADCVSLVDGSRLRSRILRGVS